MLNALNTKILLAILAALTVCRRCRDLSTRSSGEDRSSRRYRASAILQMQQHEKRLRNKQERDEALPEDQVEADKKQPQLRRRSRR